MGQWKRGKGTALPPSESLTGGGWRGGNRYDRQGERPSPIPSSSDQGASLQKGVRRQERARNSFSPPPTRRSSQLLVNGHPPHTTKHKCANERARQRERENNLLQGGSVLIPVRPEVKFQEAFCFPLGSWIDRNKKKKRWRAYQCEGNCYFFDVRTEYFACVLIRINVESLQQTERFPVFVLITRAGSGEFLLDAF